MFPEPFIFLEADASSWQVNNQSRKKKLFLGGARSSLQAPSIHTPKGIHSTRNCPIITQKQWLFTESSARSAGFLGFWPPQGPKTSQELKRGKSGGRMKAKNERFSHRKRYWPKMFSWRQMAGQCWLKEKGFLKSKSSFNSGKSKNLKIAPRLDSN